MLLLFKASLKPYNFIQFPKALTSRSRTPGRHGTDSAAPPRRRRPQRGGRLRARGAADGGMAGDDDAAEGRAAGRC